MYALLWLSIYHFLLLARDLKKVANSWFRACYGGVRSCGAIGATTQRRSRILPLEKQVIDMRKYRETVLNKTYDLLIMLLLLLVVCVRAHFCVYTEVKIDRMRCYRVN